MLISISAVLMAHFVASGGLCRRWQAHWQSLLALVVSVVVSAGLSWTVLFCWVASTPRRQMLPGSAAGMLVAQRGGRLAGESRNTAGSGT